MNCEQLMRDLDALATWYYAGKKFDDLAPAEQADVERVYTKRQADLKAKGGFVEVWRPQQRSGK